VEILSSLEAARFIRDRTERSEVEEFWAVALNPRCEVIADCMLFRGTVDGCFIHPRDVFRFALQHNATTLIVGHNHPSGHCWPSRADIVISEKLRRGGALLQIPVVDHLIVSVTEHFSFAEQVWTKKKISD
jgi:DNA repair protein RadC